MSAASGRADLITKCRSAAELVDARQVFADKKVAGIRPLHVMGHACESPRLGRSRPKEASYPFWTYSLDRALADLGYMSCTDIWPSRV